MLARALSLELTEACNYKCNMCAYWQVKAPKSIDEQKVYDLLDLVSGHPIQNITVTGGEPLLHPKWREIAQRLPQSARKFLCTNGSPILVKNHDVGALFDFITVSIDGATEGTFEKIRGYRHLGRIFSALEKIKSAHPDVKLELKMTIQRENFREVPDFFALAKQHSFIDAICLGIPDTSQQAFALTETGFDNSAYLKTLMLDPSETKEFEVLILGGEPLLHPDLVSVLETVRDAKIGEKIKLLTNGLLLHKADPKLWQILDEVRVSIYPGKELSSAQQQVAVALAERHGTTLTLQYYDIFRESILDKPNKDRQLLKRVFDTCLIAHKWHCNTIEDGHFYKCPQAYLIPNSKDPESKLSERDGIRLQDLSGFEQSLYTYLKAPHPLAACRNCLGTVGKEFPHEQVSRRKWNEFQDRPAEEMIDFDHLKALENGLVQDVPTRNVTLVENGLICRI